MRWGAPSGSGWGGGGGGYPILGLFVAKPVAWLIGATVLLTALGAVLERNGVFPVLSALICEGEKVLSGQIWRLPSWVLIEPGPLQLLFGSILLYGLGGDLAQRWGTRRFLLSYFGVASLAGALTCLLGLLLWPNLLRVPFSGMWPVLDALIIAWAMLFPDRMILAAFVLPIGGRHLVTLTIALTVVFAFMYGFAPFVPNFFAELIALVYMGVLSPRRMLLRAQLAMLQRAERRRAAGHLRVVNRKDDEPPRWTH